MTHAFVCGFSPPLQAWPPTEAKWLSITAIHSGTPSRLSAHMHEPAVTEAARNLIAQYTSSISFGATGSGKRTPSQVTHIISPSAHVLLELPFAGAAAPLLARRGPN
ncbi:hypothetical protein CCHR01_01523 [Colletotrichum chrysophilum]|uniref:Uncharacterized protein n=1 Tax=Colletotrichum chrysophilum TaxID=1836956 RepID=A0AAD9AZZ7_9PEZI|nr:hypothetical protein CCHR01_01523 [Colletotrichum chrysophilum]